MAYLRNEGGLPEAAILRDEAGTITGYRAVHVRLFSGFDTKQAGHAPWPAAGGRPATRWAVSRVQHGFEISEYEVV